MDKRYHVNDKWKVYELERSFQKKDKKLGAMKRELNFGKIIIPIILQRPRTDVDSRKVHNYYLHRNTWIITIY